MINGCCGDFCYWFYLILQLTFNKPFPISFVYVDMKWDGLQVTDLYCSAIVHRRGIKSIRDLRAEHLPLLHNILDKGCEAIKEKYNVDRSQLIMYFHYQPSY